MGREEKTKKPSLKKSNKKLSKKIISSSIYIKFKWFLFVEKLSSKVGPQYGKPAGPKIDPNFSIIFNYILY